MDSLNKIRGQGNVFLFLGLSHGSSNCLNGNRADYRDLEHRISTTPHSLNTSVCNQVLRSCGVSRGPTNVRKFKRDAIPV